MGHSCGSYQQTALWQVMGLNAKINIKLMATNCVKYYIQLQYETRIMQNTNELYFVVVFDFTQPF